jgi:hypothetical protein
MEGTTPTPNPDLDNLLVDSLIAADSLTPYASSLVQAPAHTEDAVRATWQQAEEVLADCKGSVGVTDRAHSHEVHWDPHMGLYVTVTHGGVPRAWGTVPTTVLATLSPLVTRLLVEAGKARIKASAQLQSTVLTAVVADGRQEKPTPPAPVSTDENPLPFGVSPAELAEALVPVPAPVEKTPKKPRKKG